MKRSAPSSHEFFRERRMGTDSKALKLAVEIYRSSTVFRDTSYLRANGSRMVHPRMANDDRGPSFWGFRSSLEGPRTTNRNPRKDP